MSFNKKYNMRKNLVIAFLSISLAFGSSTFAVYGQSNDFGDFSNFSDAQILQFIAQLQQLLAQKNGQYQNSSAQAASSVYVSSGCSYTFTRDLTVGSSGSDVKKLQEFLNSDSSTLVAISGAGSKNQETNYFGPATKSAVAKFQNKYASEVLAPYGLTSGTGYFGPSTRSKANQVCSAQTVSSTSQQQQVEIPVQQSQNYNQNFVASGATLAVNATQQPKNGIAVENAQRVPYTNIVLTAGSDDVLVEGIRVQLQGVTERDNFSGIAVITSSGAQIGTDRGLRSDNSVVVGGRFTVKRGTSATLTIVGNVADGQSSGASISGVGQLQVTEVLANKAVTGNFPIGGAQHTFSDALTLGAVTVSGGSTTTGNVDIGDDNFEFAEYTVALRSNGDEDAYLRSITFEQNGSASSDDLKDVSVRVDSRNSYKPAVNGDRYTIVFPGNGISIEEGDNVDISIEGTIISGYNRNIRFDIDDVSDVYVVGASRGYGLPVTASGVITGRTFTVQAGEGDSSDADFISKSDKNIRAENDQIIGAFELEVESEEIDIDDTTFTLNVENTTSEGLFGFDGTSNEFSQIEISDIKIVDFNTGKVFAEADDYETLSPTSDSAVDAGPKELSIEFNSLYTLPVGETNIVITADLDKEFANATKFQISTWDWGNVEGVVTGEDLKSKLGVLEDSKFGEFSIDGDEVTISADSSIESREIVAGSNGVEFIVVEFDASQSKEDVEFEEVFVTVTLGNNANIEHLSNCVLTDDDGDEIGEYSNGNDELSGTDSFQFNIDDKLKVKAGEIAEVSVRCDVDKDADEITDGTYIFAISSTDSVDYEIDGDSESVIPDGKDSPSVTIKSFGELDESTVVESDKNWAVGNSDLTVPVGKFEVAAQREGFTVDEIVLTVDVTNGDEEDSVERVEIKYDGKTATEEITSSGSAGTKVTFEDLNWNISDQVNKEVAEISLILNTIGHGDASGRNITTTINSYEAEGDDSGNEPDKSGRNLALGKVNTYKSLPVFSVDSQSTSEKNLSSNKDDTTIFEFVASTNGDGSNLALNKITASIEYQNVTFASSDAFTLHAYTDGNRTAKVSGTGDDGLVSTIDGTNGTNAFSFTPDPVFVGEGEKIYFAIKADVVTVTLDTDANIVTELVGESFADAVDGVAAGSVSGNIVFSPNTLENPFNVSATDTDWFAAKGTDIIPSDLDSWRLEK